MEGMDLKFAPVIGKRLLYTPFKCTCLGLWLTFLGTIASPNSPNGGFNPPPATHALPPAAPPTYHLSTPYNVPSMILQ